MLLLLPGQQASRCGYSVRYTEGSSIRGHILHDRAHFRREARGGEGGGGGGGGGGGALERATSRIYFGCQTQETGMFFKQQAVTPPYTPLHPLAPPCTPLHPLARYGLGSLMPELKIVTPRCFILATEIFDRFIDDNELMLPALSATSDEQIRTMFEKAQLPTDVTAELQPATRCNPACNPLQPSLRPDATQPATRC